MNGSSRTTKRLKAINTGMKPFLRGTHDPERAWARAVDRAQHIAGVGIDADDQAWVEEFRFLISCVAEAQGLTPVGWFTTMKDSQERLVNRLRVRDLHRRFPQIGHEPIERPVFVVGLPRTATTLAHQILAAAPGCRGPRLWEMTRTDLELPPDQTAQIVGRAKRQFQTVKYAPDFQHIHPIDPERPEESMFALPHGLYRVVFHLPMPAYRAWFASRDTTPDYQYFRQVIQVLQYGRPRRRWVFKYPFDLSQLQVIKRVFPGATFVWTHRDPATVIGSTCSLTDLCQSLFVARPDREAIGKLVLDVLEETIEAGRAFRRANQADVVDVPYHQLTADATLTVPRLFQRLGLEFTQADGERLAIALQKPQRDRKHEWDLRDYGLKPETVETRFSSYQAWVNSLNYGRLSGPPASDGSI